MRKQRSRRRTATLEKRIESSTPQEDRLRPFVELCRRHAGQLFADAVKWAQARRLPDPLAAGSTAFSRAIISAADRMDELETDEESWLLCLREGIWAELSEIKKQSVVGVLVSDILVRTTPVTFFLLSSL